MIKLGIIVVYLVDDNNEKLLDIHLDQIEKNTVSNFTIYASINLLNYKFIKTLGTYDFIKTIRCNDYKGANDATRGAKEHSYYLTQLIDIAIKDGSTHIAIFHPDSFPISNKWDIKYLEQLSEDVELISIFPHMTGFMIFDVSTYIKYRPNLLPSDEEQLSKDWKNFQKYNNVNNLVESGMWFAHTIVHHGKKWIKLVDALDNNSIKLYGQYFDGHIFHLGSASDYKNRTRRNININKRNNYIRIVPRFIKNIIKNNIAEKYLFRETVNNNKLFIKTRDHLFEDTQGFINLLRNQTYNKVNKC